MNFCTNKTTIFLATIFLAGSAFSQDIDAALEDERTTQTGTAITIIFDNSGSMADKGKINQAKKAFLTWLKNLPDDYALALVDFNKGKGRLAVPLDKGKRDAVAKHVAAAKAYGKTPICDCLKIAQTEIGKRRSDHSPYERHVVVVFTDGYETIDKRGNDGVNAEIEELRKRVVEVVGIGFHGQGDYMEKTATAYFHANDEKELVAGLSNVDAEIGDDADIDISDEDRAVIEKTEIPLPPAPIPEKE